MMRNPSRLACVCAALWATGLAWADLPPPENRVAFVASAWQVADDDTLGRLRGGFELNTGNPGLAISFGFARTVTINGDLVSRTVFRLPDLSNITADQAKQVSDALAQARVVQNGLGNNVGGSVGSSSGSSAASTANNAADAARSLAGATIGPLAALAGATVVQNSLSNQNILTLTQIDTGVNSLGILHAMNVQGILRDALMGSVGVR